MSEPFVVGDKYVIIENGRWIKFPSDKEAWEYYKENKENKDET